MSVLQQIVQEATSPNADVARMLRLRLVLAARLNHPPLREWVQNELNGFPPDATIPTYRIVAGRHQGKFVTRAGVAVLDIPLQLIPGDHREQFTTISLSGPVAEYISLAQRSGEDGRLQSPWPTELAVHHVSNLVEHGQCIAAWTEISPADLVAMLDQIKTRVLGFALDIEAASPNAGTIPGVPNEVPPATVAHSFVTNIMGNVGVMQTGAQATTNVIK